MKQWLGSDQEVRISDERVVLSFTDNSDIAISEFEDNDSVVPDFESDQDQAMRAKM